MSLETILEQLQAEEAEVLATISKTVQQDKEWIIEQLSNGKQIEHDVLVKAHQYIAEIKNMIGKVEELINWKK